MWLATTPVSTRTTSLLCTQLFQQLLSSYFFLPPPAASSFLSQEMTFPNMTTPLPSMKVTQTSGCCGWKEHSAISFDFRECGSSIFLPPVSLPIFHTNLEMRHAERPHRTKPIG